MPCLRHECLGRKRRIDKAVKSEVAAKWNQAQSQRSPAAGKIEALSVMSANRIGTAPGPRSSKIMASVALMKRRSPSAKRFRGERDLQDTLVEPDSVAVDSSVARGRLLFSNDIFALGLDVANTADATNTIEKLLAHEIALAHKLALEEAAQARKERDPQWRSNAFRHRRE